MFIMVMLGARWFCFCFFAHSVHVIFILVLFCRRVVRSACCRTRRLACHSFADWSCLDREFWGIAAGCPTVAASHCITQVTTLPLFQHSHNDTRSSQHHSTHIHHHSHHPLQQTVQTFGNAPRHNDSPNHRLCRT